MEPDAALVAFADVESILPDAGPAMLVKALETCDALVRCRVPLVLCSGRTRAQLERVRRALAVYHPFVTEHGAAVFVPIGYFPERVPAARDVSGFDVIEFVRPYAETVDSLRRTASQLQIDLAGFHDMSVEEVAGVFGLSMLDARLAKLREYTEPFRILGDDDRARERLFRALRGEGIACARGEPYHCAGVPANRQAALAMIQEVYERAYRRPVLMTDLATAATHLPTLRRHVTVAAGSPASPDTGLVAAGRGSRVGQSLRAFARRLWSGRHAADDDR